MDISINSYWVSHWNTQWDVLLALKSLIPTAGASQTTSETFVKSGCLRTRALLDFCFISRKALEATKVNFFPFFRQLVMAAIIELNVLAMFFSKKNVASLWKLGISKFGRAH